MHSYSPRFSSKKEYLKHKHVREPHIFTINTRQDTGIHFFSFVVTYCRPSYIDIDTSIDIDIEK